MADHTTPDAPATSPGDRRSDNVAPAPPAEPIFWQPGYEIGVRSVDTEHRVLFMTFNRFVQIKNRRSGNAAADYAISFLSEYLSYHFRHEEDLMRKVNYDQFTGHVAEHHRLEKCLIKLKAGLSSDKDVGDESLAMFRDWLLGHVIKEDRDIGVFLTCRERFRSGIRLASGASPDTGAGERLSQPGKGDATMGITALSARIFKRHGLNLAGRVANHLGDEFPVVVNNISQQGAMLSGVAGLFKEGLGVLKVPAITERDLPFVVMHASDVRASVCFTIGHDDQLILRKRLQSPDFGPATGGAPAGDSDGDCDAWGDDAMDGGPGGLIVADVAGL